MIRLAILLVALLALMLLFRMAIKGKAKEATLEEARTIGLQEAEGHIQSPILLEDYAEARGISQERLESMVERREIPSFRWHQYTYIENRELIDINKQSVLGDYLSLLKSLNRYMERNHAASRALLVQLDRKSITDLDDLNEELWVSINSTQSETYRLELIDDGVVSLEFIVKLLVKLGFSCEDSIRLMMKAHKDGSVVLARAEEGTLLNLKSYISTQAKNHGHALQARIIKT